MAWDDIAVASTPLTHDCEGASFGDVSDISYPALDETVRAASVDEHESEV